MLLLLVFVIVGFFFLLKTSKNHQTAISSQETLGVNFINSQFKNKATSMESITDSPLGQVALCASEMSDRNIPSHSKDLFCFA